MRDLYTIQTQRIPLKWRMPGFLRICEEQYQFAVQCLTISWMNQSQGSNNVSGGRS